MEVQSELIILVSLVILPRKKSLCVGESSLPESFQAIQLPPGEGEGEEIEKCLDGGLEPTYYFSIFKMVVNRGNKEGSSANWRVE